MKKYKVRIIETRVDEYLEGYLNVFKNYYLIITENDKKNYYPKSKVIINEL
jgi:hypothetical protein